MTDLYSGWRDFYAKKVRSWMSLEELRAECGRLYTVDAPSVELLLIHAMHALEEREQRDEALLRQVLEAFESLSYFEARDVSGVALAMDAIRERLKYLMADAMLKAREASND